MFLLINLNIAPDIFLFYLFYFYFFIYLLIYFFYLFIYLVIYLFIYLRMNVSIYLFFIYTKNLKCDRTTLGLSLLDY